MTVEIALVISFISLVFTMVTGIINQKRGAKNDNQSEAAAMTTVIVKLENIGSDIKDIKNDMKSVKADLQKHEVKIATLEQQVKVLNKAVFKNESTGG